MYRCACTAGDGVAKSFFEAFCKFQKVGILGLGKGDEYSLNQYVLADFRCRSVGVVKLNLVHVYFGKHSRCGDDLFCELLQSLFVATVLVLKTLHDGHFENFLGLFLAEFVVEGDDFTVNRT